jgi:DNA end-binding protein Ku
VAIPVQLVKAVETGRISFRMLHRKDYSPLRRRMFCPKEDSIVPPDEIIRGYEIGPDKYVLITDEELESVSPERSRTIEIVEFIDMHEVDSVYFDHPYYLLPLKGGEKAYQLLAEAMRRTNKAGLAKFVLDEREYLVAVKSSEGALVLITLHYRDEILPAEGISPKEETSEAEEKERMKKSVRKMMTDFAPEKYADRRREKILNLLKKKAKEKAPVEAPEVEGEEGEGPADLIAALEESMRRMKKSR